MNRKNFLSTILPLGAVITASARRLPLDIGNKKIPPYLKAGDTIGICSVAGYLTLQDCTDAINMIQSWGYKIKLGTSVGKKYFTFGGTDEERIADFQQMLDDENLKAIMCARGGYGLVRIIDKLNFSTFIKKPKWIIGFSDATVLHSHIQKNFGIATLHSKMCNSFVPIVNAEPAQLSSLESIRKCLEGIKMSYEAPRNINNKNGIAKGILVGGNLKTVESLAGSSSDINTKNKILFVEDTGEYLYSIDRMFWNLKRTGKLTSLAGLIIGGFKVKKDDAGEEFGKTVEEIVLEKTVEYNYPICFDFPVGHQKNNMALKCGVEHILNIDIATTSLKEA